MPRRGMGGIYQRGDVWWIRYYERGMKKYETSRDAARGILGTKQDAVRLLKKRIVEIETHTYVGADARKLMLEELREILEADYDANERRSTKRAMRAFHHLAGFFGRDRAVDITGFRLVGYVAHRRKEGAKPSTIRNELAALKRAFKLAVASGALPTRPVFPSIEVNNARKGFFEEPDFQAVRSHLHDDIKPLAEFLYLSGWRKTEAMGLEWRQVDLKAGVLRIEDTKTDDPKTLPFHAAPDLAELIKRQRERATQVQQDVGVVVMHVFFWSHDGSQVRDFRGAWAKACEAAGLKRIVHDLRRTAARNLSRRGVPQKVIMEICGWKTSAMFERYRIVNERELADGLAKLERLGDVAEPTPSRVVELRTGTERGHSGHKVGRRGSVGSRK